MKYIELKNGNKWPLNTAYNGDCLDFMRLLPDKCIDLVLTDPPYGIGESGKKRENNKSDKWNAPTKKEHNLKDWDNKVNLVWFDEIFRISKHQIIWGGNYFVEKLPASMGWIFWDKKNGNSDFSDGELAFTSFDCGLRKFEYLWNGFQKERPEDRFHPTQKPLKLFKWCLEKYAPENAVVFDPFLGSFTTAVACHSHGLSWTGCEQDEDYFKAGMDRYETECLQGLLGF